MYSFFPCQIHISITLHLAPLLDLIRRPPYAEAVLGAWPRVFSSFCQLDMVLVLVMDEVTKRDTVKGLNLGLDIGCGLG